MVSGSDVVIDGWVVHSMPHGTLQSMPVLGLDHTVTIPFF